MIRQSLVGRAPRLCPPAHQRAELASQFLDRSEMTLPLEPDALPADGLSGSSRAPEEPLTESAPLMHEMACVSAPPIV